MKSVYIHIPFCKHICTYCDFCKINYQKEWVNDYLETLEEEIIERYNSEEIETLYIGGGTPSCLDEEDLNKLFKVLKKINLASQYEFTFECNLDDINEMLLTILKENGVNRLSIGIESFDKDNQKFMERSHTFEDAEEGVKLARNLGFNNINVDLMYALPNETLSTLKKDIQKILKLDVEHISTYSLIIEENTKAYINETKAISEDVDAKMYEYIVKKLTSAGYTHYEVSNFAKEGYESLHNLNYWDNDYYYGFGLGAHGFIHGLRYENTRSLNNYLENKYVLEENIISKNQDMENELILGLRKMGGINISDFFQKFEVNIQDVFPIKPLLKSKELIYKDGYIFINPEKIYVMNEILVKLI